ncbi:MAG: cobyric acid synthase [Fretibacterium sp.]|nr:cobyric acid synthase [Fretibacterium sp.]
MKGIMIQGASSDAGKSFLATGLCRFLADRGVRVCPFKSQNMSNNSFVTHDGREISRAQAVQAAAARLLPETFMNPILLKPRRDNCSQIILDGLSIETPADRGYYRSFAMNQGIEAIRRALRHIEVSFDVVVIEGAGSPAEVNLNATEIVNMRVARLADVPVILVADVDRGGSLASVVGTLELLGDDRERVKGLVFNKFRGDLELFDDAVRWVQDRTGVPVLGVMPWLKGVTIAGEDSLSLHWGRGGSSMGLSVGVVRFPGLANYTDLEPFGFEPDVELVGLDEEFPLRRLSLLDAVILPDSRAPVEDARWLRSTGLAGALKDFAASGGRIFGMGGGYRMLGLRLKAQQKGAMPQVVEGLGLLPLITDFSGAPVAARTRTGTLHPSHGSLVPVAGCEMSQGWTRPEGEGAAPLLLLDGAEEGCALSGIQVAGSSLSGLFESDAFRAHWLKGLRDARGLEPVLTDTLGMKERAYDALADAVRGHLDTERLLSLMGL